MSDTHILPSPPPSSSPAVLDRLGPLSLMAIGATLFAFMNFFAKIATTSASWSSVAAVRALVGAGVALAVARLRHRSLAGKNARALFWRSLLGTCAMLSTFYALSSRTMALGNTVTLLNLSPVFLAVLAPIFLREKTTGMVALAILVALSGVILVVHPAFLFGGDAAILITSPSGPSMHATALVAVCAALSTSIAMMLLRRVGQSETPEAIAFHFSLFAAAAMTIISLFDLRMPTLRDAACMVAAGLCAGFAQLAMTRAYSLEHAARVSGMSYLSVVASAVLGAVALHEHPSQTAIVGMALVIAGGVLVTFGRSKVATTTTTTTTMTGAS